MRCTFESLIEKMIGEKKSRTCWCFFLPMPNRSSILNDDDAVVYAKSLSTVSTGCVRSDRKHSSIPIRLIDFDSRSLAVQKSSNRFGSHLIETSKNIFSRLLLAPLLGLSSSPSISISLHYPLSPARLWSDRRVFTHLRTQKESRRVFARTRRDLPRKKRKKSVEEARNETRIPRMAARGEKSWK